MNTRQRAVTGPAVLWEGPAASHSNQKVCSQHFSGLEEAVYRNIQACKELARTTRTAYGPNGKLTFCFRGAQTPAPPLAGERPEGGFQRHLQSRPQSGSQCQQLGSPLGK